MKSILMIGFLLSNLRSAVLKSISLFNFTSMFKSKKKHTTILNRIYPIRISNTKDSNSFQVLDLNSNFYTL